MWISQITLKNYRNYKEAKVEFSPQLNIFLGKNAQGKTNFLEAIYFLALTRSHRTRVDKELIAFNNKELSLTGKIIKNHGNHQLDIYLSNKGRITKINHLKQAKLSDYIGSMTVVLFAPEDLQLIKGSPSLRRKFIDIDLGQIKPTYLSDLSYYNHTLKQRNTYLKSTQTVDFDFLSVLDQQLADYGSKVMKHRLQFIEQIAQKADEHHFSLSNTSENITINYVSSIFFQSIDTIKEDFLKQLEKNRQRDVFKKNTSIGPHRDDIDFFINQINATFGSQGQQRSLILSLKLAEIDLIKNSTGETPILLLDDVMSELDNHRQLKLLETIANNDVQTFITTTSLDHLSNLPEELKIFHVNHGCISQDNHTDIS